MLLVLLVHLRFIFIFFLTFPYGQASKPFLVYDLRINFDAQFVQNEGSRFKVQEFNKIKSILSSKFSARGARLPSVGQGSAFGGKVMHSWNAVRGQV